jgi:hypothetical protein
LFGFGVVDVSIVGTNGKEADHLFFHLYQEGYGLKGGSNVASLLMKTLIKTKTLRLDDNGDTICGKELNIVMDNCGGQNKNNFVLLLAPYLVELGYFKRVNMIFLVVGHTKNVCDQRFNNLKQEYHRSQVFTLSQAVEVLDECQFVTVWPVDVNNDWKDYESFLLQPYQKLSKSKLKITSNHIFCAETIQNSVDGNENNRSSMRFYTRMSNMDEHQAVYGDVANPSFATGGNRLKSLKALTPEPVIYDGLPGYKQILMYKKYRPFVPLELHTEDLYKKPPPATWKSEEEYQKMRKQMKKEKKAAKVVSKIL